MDDLIIYKEKNFIEKNNYYKKLGVNAILIDPFDRIDKEVLQRLFEYNKTLAREEIKLILRVDIEQISSLLLDINKPISWSNPKIRKSFYQFIIFLQKHGIRGFLLENFVDLLKDDLYKYTGELTKNIFYSEDSIFIGQIDTIDYQYLSYLINSSYNNFTYILNPSRFYGYVDLKSIKKEISKSFDRGIKEIYQTKNLYGLIENKENYPFQIQSLLAGLVFMLRGGVIINDFEELGIFNKKNFKSDYKILDLANKTFDFYKKLIDIKKNNKPLAIGDYRQIVIRDREIFAFIRTLEDEKILVFANFSQKEILVDLRYKLLDLYKFTYLIGNYGRRRIFKNLLLRPYEFVAFKR